MPTILAGQVVPVFFSSDGSISITPGDAGRVSLNARAQDGSEGIAPREIYSAQTINVQAGTTVVVEAINTNASYTVSSSSGGVVDAASVQAALSSDQAGGRTALGLGTAATQNSTEFLTPAQRPEVATWADLPAANSVPVGRTYTVLNTGWRVYSNGTNWRPANGRLLIAQRCGSVASPIATLTGVTAGMFTLPITPTIPAGMLGPHSRLYTEALVRRTTATATAIATSSLGTTGGTSDPNIFRVSMPASATSEVRISSFAAVDGSSATAYCAANAIPENAASAAQLADRNTNINTAAAMVASFGVTSANAADVFALVYYSVWMEA